MDDIIDVLDIAIKRTDKGLVFKDREGGGFCILERGSQPKGPACKEIMGKLRTPEYMQKLDELDLDF